MTGEVNTQKGNIAQLAKQLQSGTPDERGNAVYELHKMPEDDAIELLVRAAREDDDAGLRSYARAVLGIMGRYARNPRIQAAVADILNTRNQAVQACVSEILTDAKLRKEYNRNPNAVLKEKLKDLPVHDQEQANAEVKLKVKEVEEVFPGLTRDEAKDMLVTSLELPKSSFAIFTWLNVVLFGVGIALLVIAAVVGIVREQEQFTAMFGAGGLATVLSLFLIDPLKRISNAASDQSQLRIVVFGFWSQLANWRTELLALTESVDFETIKKVNAEVQKTVEHASGALQKYVETKEQKASSDKELKALQSRLEALENRVGQPGG